MDPDINEDVAITYMYLKNGKWKTKTKLISEEKLSNYQTNSYRILGTMSSYEYYHLMDYIGCNNIHQKEGIIDNEAIED